MTDKRHGERRGRGRSTSIPYSVKLLNIVITLVRVMKKMLETNIIM